MSVAGESDGRGGVLATLGRFCRSLLGGALLGGADGRRERGFFGGGKRKRDEDDSDLLEGGNGEGKRARRERGDGPECPRQAFARQSAATGAAMR